MSNILLLYWEFFKTGLFAVGGGMATVPFLSKMSENHPEWFSMAELADMIAVSESTPGPIGINMATYVGFKTAGIPGTFASVLGIITPCIVVILIIASVLDAFRKNKYVDSAFKGLRPCSVGLIAAAGVTVLKICMLDIDTFSSTGSIFDLINYKAVILAALLLLFTRKIEFTKKLHPVYFIIFSAAAGFIFSF